MKHTKKLIFTALLSALTFVATFVIKLPTPTMGYIHPGDAVVLICGTLLGPVYGGFAAGFGSMLADLVGGYFTYAPATFVIKALTAVIAAFLYKEFQKFWNEKKKTASFIISTAAASVSKDSSSRATGQSEIMMDSFSLSVPSASLSVQKISSVTKGM